jgi:radical SAM superfamily enzyme YgiQ (UPF0313 family)
MEEIHLLVKRFGVREIQFLDSNFLFSKRFIISFCEAVLHSDLDLAFCAPNGMRLESLDEEVCRLLARIGFYRANLGVESGSPEILRMVQKHAVPDQFRRKVPLLRKQGIYVVGNFMLGFPGETRDQMEQTLGLALSLDLSGANFAIYTPFPGTPLYEGLVKLGKLEANRTFRNYNYVTYDNELSALSARDLRRFRNWCAFRFLFRWRTVRTLAGVLKDRRLLGSIIKRVYGMYIQKLFTD